MTAEGAGGASHQAADLLSSVIITREKKKKHTHNNNNYNKKEFVMYQSWLFDYDAVGHDRPLVDFLFFLFQSQMKQNW